MFEQEIKQLTTELSATQSNVLTKASQILKSSVTQQSLNAIIGGKNSTHAGVHKKTFTCFEEFFVSWLEGMYNDYLSRASDPNPMTKAGYRNALLLQEPDIMDYAERFLKRNFLKNYDKRTAGTKPTTTNIAGWQSQINKYKCDFSNIIP